ncbi:hypothetical protein VXM60_17330 [Shewanella khirikhana]|uniref:hypothetical protein n=1 Tax=Shewanella khirikhana TaxID=1965282 RepID=UPI0030CA6826
MPTLSPLPGQRDLPCLVFLLILLSVIVGALGILASMLYHLQSGTMGWDFRPSGLGNYLISPLAWVYNAALIWAGLWLMLAMLALGFAKPQFPDLYLPLSGGWLGLTVSLMGIFPEHYGALHSALAVCFTLGMAVTHALVLAARFKGNIHYASPFLMLLSLLGLGCAIPILGQVDWPKFALMICPPTPAQPCLLDVLLWLQLVLGMLWCLVLAGNIRRKVRSRPEF